VGVSSKLLSSNCQWIGPAKQNSLLAGLRTTSEVSEKAPEGQRHCKIKLVVWILSCHAHAMMEEQEERRK